jgi:putative acetyltransferase
MVLETNGKDKTGVVVRQEANQDTAQVRAVNLLAFAQPAEADLVDLLRTRGKLVLSLVALRQERLVGHIAFSTVRIEPELPAINGVGLGPLAVLPDFQRQGTGSLLVTQGLQRVSRLGMDYVVVLGHPAYYPRLCFVPASKFGLRCQWPVPDEAFMAFELRPGALQDVSGVVSYEPEFNNM